MKALADIECCIIEGANILAWNLAQPLFSANLDPFLQDLFNWISHNENNIVDQREENGASLLRDWQLVKFLIHNVPEVTGTRLA